MNEHAVAGRARPEGRLSRARRWLSRAAGSNGAERQTVALVLKSTLAATISWEISYSVIGAQTPAFAPFSAVLIMQLTVYRSVWQALQLVGAVALGVAAQGVLGLSAGPDLVTFVLVALVGLAIGHWPPLRGQGTQVPTAAFFAFSLYVTSTGTTEKLTQLGQIILLVLIGCGVGLLVNVIVLPPVRYRSAEHGIQALTQSLCDLLHDIYPALREGRWEEEAATRWRERASRVDGLVVQAQAGVLTASESTYYDFWRFSKRRAGRRTFEDYQAVVNALERVTQQLSSITRSLQQWSPEEEQTSGHEFLRVYGDFLGAVAPCAQVLTGLGDRPLADQTRELCDAVAQGQEARNGLVEAAQGNERFLSDPSAPYGSLLADAVRLIDEFQHTCDVLKHAVDA